MDRFFHSPQVSFFDPLVDDLIKEWHQCVITCRDSANTLQLVKQRNWPHKVIPENLSLEKVIKQGANPSKTAHYPVIKEGVYLWVKGEEILQMNKNVDIKDKKR